MDKVWFHNCITGFFTLAGIHKNDLESFCSRFSFQANIRVLRALKVKDRPHDSLEDAWYIPDRNALFHQVQANNYLNKIGLGKPAFISSPTVEVVSLDTQETHRPGKEKSILLPKYIKPQQDLQQLEVDDELADLEYRLLADISEDEIKEQQLIMNMSPDGGNKSTPPKKLPIMDRMSLDMDNRAFGRPIPAKSVPNTGFILWLNRINELPSPITEDTVPPVTQVNPEVLSKSHEDKTDMFTPDARPKIGSKKKKKKRKEAKLLAKASVRKSNEIATETLAGLLVQQGHTDQAIEMFERLILMFPEKKSTFAAQIAKIKRKQL